MAEPALLEVERLSKHFPVRGGWLGGVQGWIRAVDEVSFALPAGETLALVGESGCGKTTVGRCVLRLLEPSRGRVRFGGVDLLAQDRGSLRALRRRMQPVFQDPYSSLNPRLTVGQILAEPLRVHGLAKGAELGRRVGRLLEQVGLAEDYRHRYPHEFSGGQRQRIGIARALALEPQLIVCDEAVSALDVSIQAQIVNLLRELQAERGLAYLFITHDLNLVQYLADQVAVMYLGRIVERAAAADLFARPAHPYSRALIAANPVPDPDSPLRAEPLEGDVPSPIDPPSGCHFHPRCPRADALCSQQAPPPRARDGETQATMVACHHPLSAG